MEGVKLPALLILDDVSQQTLPAQGAFFFLFAATCRWPQPMSSASTRCTGPLSRLSRHSLPSHGRLVAPSALANGGCGEQRLQDIARTGQSKRSATGKSAKLVTAIELTRPTSGGILEFGELALCPITPSA